MSNISQRLAGLAMSETLAMSQRSRELQAQGADVINLSIGQPDFNTPDHIKEAAKRAIDDNFSHYTPIPGLPQLRKAIVDKLKNENGFTYSMDQVVVSNGAKQSIANVLLSIINPGDEVIVPAPYWVSYVEMVKLAEGENVIVEAGIDQDFKITAQQLEEAITPNTKALLFSSPSNPTGSLYTREELAQLAAVIKRYPQIVVISDEIYELINYEGSHESIAQFDEIKEQVVIINGVSKGYAMTGWRIGYLAAPLWIAKACTKLQGQYTSGACAVAQMASVAALNGGVACAMKMKEAFRRRRDMVVKLAGEIPGLKVNVPPGAFYLFPDVSYYLGKKFGEDVIANSTELSMYLLEHAHVATVTGSAFGSPNCIRFSYATSDEKLEEAMRRIKTALAQLK